MGSLAGRFMVLFMALAMQQAYAFSFLSRFQVIKRGFIIHQQTPAPSQNIDQILDEILSASPSNVAEALEAALNISEDLIQGTGTALPSATPFANTPEVSPVPAEDLTETPAAEFSSEVALEPTSFGQLTPTPTIASSTAEGGPVMLPPPRTPLQSPLPTSESTPTRGIEPTESLDNSFVPPPTPTPAGVAGQQLPPSS